MKRHLQGLFSCFLIGLAVSVSEIRFYVVAATTAEGDVLEDTTWVVANSPYLILDDVEVHEGVTLTIDPGVVVRFNDNSSFIVAGSLFAVGTFDSRIVFTSSLPDPAAGQWSGVEFVGGDTESLILKFVEIKYAKNGILVESQGKAVVEKSEISSNSLSGIHVIGLSNVLIKDNIISQNVNGISTAGNTIYGMTIANNTISSNDENGIYIYTSGADVCRIFNVTISGNHISQNANGIYLFSNAGTENAEAYIHRVGILDNTVSSNDHGVRLRAHGWWAGYIYDSTISGNTISLNEEGINIYSGSNWFRWIANITISKNKVFSNKNGISLDGFRVGASYDPFEFLPFDANIVENTISANENKGITVLGDVRANFTGNSISYNSYGIYITTKGNRAINNDIYQNSLYGMYITSVHVAVKARVIAEYNYWGAPNGPHHEELNPDGMGDRVCCGEENLDFKPFLTEPFGVVNQVPVAVLNVERTMVAVNQTVVFNGSESSDDSSIIEYFFDFGDGETAQVFQGVIGHEYASIGNYNVSLVVRDDLGVKSTNTAAATVNVTTPPLVVTVSLSLLSVISEEEVTVQVLVSDGFAGLQEAFVELASEEGGNFEPPSGYTDSKGDFNAIYSAPPVSEPTTLRIVATASKEGYENGSASINLDVHAPPPSGIEAVPRWIWLVMIAAIGVVGVLMLLMRKWKTTHREEEDVSAMG